MLRSWPRLVVVALVVGVGGGACIDSKASSPTPEDLEAIDLSADHTITVDEAGFHPADLEILSGEVVLVVNEGDGLHSFTAEERFDTGRLEPGEETTLLLAEPGEIPYRDLESDHEAVLTILPAEG